MIQGAIALLSNIVTGMVDSILFQVLGRFVRSFFLQQTRHRDRRSVGLVLDRLI